MYLEISSLYTIYFETQSLAFGLQMERTHPIFKISNNS